MLAAAAASVLAVDLAHKVHAVAGRGDDLIYHDRPLAYVVGIMVGAGAWCLALLATRSKGLALCGGLVLGGAAGNALSLLLWPAYDGTPNPFLVGDVERGIAFNVADVAVVAAVILVLPLALGVFIARNRHRLRDPIRLRG